MISKKDQNTVSGTLRVDLYSTGGAGKEKRTISVRFPLRER